MAIGIAKNNSVVAVNEESSQGTYVGPASASDGYIQPLDADFIPQFKRETIERNILTSSIGKVTPRVGLKSVSGSLPVEFRASGTEGADVDYGILLEAALGATRSISSNITTKNSGNTGSVLQIEDADIASLSVGDIIVVKESGLHWPCAITAKTSGAGTATITISPAKPSGSFSNSVVLSKSKMYYTANSGHPPFSVSVWPANETLMKAIGCRVTSMSLDNFSTGQVASLSFGYEGLDYDEANGSASHTPSYDTGLPPIILDACIYQDGVEIKVNKLSFSLENTLGKLTDTCDGNISSRLTARKVTGSFNPYKDDTSVANFTLFNTNAPFSLFLSAYNPSNTSGEISMGSCVGIYFPNCVITERGVGDLDGILTEEITFQATRGTSGSTEEMYYGLI
jgi:hypothetical protein